MKDAEALQMFLAPNARTRVFYIDATTVGTYGSIVGIVQGRVIRATHFIASECALFNSSYNHELTVYRCGTMGSFFALR